METWQPLGQFRVGFVDLDWTKSANINANDLNHSNVSISIYMIGKCFICNMMLEYNDWVYFKYGDHVDLQHITGRVFYPCTPQRRWWKLIPGVSWLASVHYAYGRSCNPCLA